MVSIRTVLPPLHESFAPLASAAVLEILSVSRVGVKPASGVEGDTTDVDLIFI